MNVKSTIVKNIGVLFLMNILGSILMFILSINIARFLGDAEFGRYSFAFAFSYLFVIFVDLGLNHLLVREVARDKEAAGKYVNNIFTVKVILSCFVLIAIVLAQNIMRFPTETRLLVYIIGGYSILTSLAQTFKSVFCAFEKMEYESLLTIIEKFILALGGLTLLHMGKGLIAVAFIFLFAGLVNTSLSILTTVRKFTTLKLDFDLVFWKHLIKDAVPIGLTVFFISIYEKIDIVMLEALKDNTVVGWYGVSYALTSALIIIPGTILPAVYPVFSRDYNSAYESFVKIYEKSFSFLFAFIFPIAIGTTLLAKDIILMIYGPAFVNSIGSLKVLIWSDVFGFINLLLIYVLQSMNKQNLFAKATGFCALFNVCLNFLLIPWLSHIGASVATVFSQTVLFILLFYSVSSYIHTNLLKAIMNPLIAGLAMGFLILCLKTFIDFFWVVILAIGLYFTSLFALDRIVKRDKRAIKNL